MHNTVCPHDCPSVCALEVEKTDEGRLGKVRGSGRDPYTAGVVCAKVSRYAERYHHKDRLARPMRRVGARGSGEFEPMSWDDALDEVAENLIKAEQALGAETVWPYWYAGTMGFVQRDGIKRLTHVKGYSRFYSTICTVLADTGWLAGYGKRWGVPAEEAGGHSDLMICWGGNPVSTHVNLMTHISRAKKRGAPFVVIDPYRSPTAEQADMHLIVRPSTDGALACAVMHVLFRDGYADRDYLHARTDAPDELEAHLKSRTPEWAAAITGLSVEEIEKFAKLYGEAQRPWIRFSYGFTRCRNGSAAMHAASSIPVVRGAYQYEGAGAQYNMGDLYNWDKTLIEGLDAVNPESRIIDQCRIGPALMGDPADLQGGPPITALLIQNTNPMCIAPELGLVHQGFAREDLFVAVQEQFMTDTAKQADILLPATMFIEHDDIYHASGHSRFRIGPKLFEPYAECRTNHYVICELAKRLGASHPGFEMTEWELIEDLFKRSGWPDAKTVLEAGGWEAMIDKDQAHFRNGFPTEDGKYRFKPDWASLGPNASAMPALPDHMAIADEITPMHPYRLVAAPARQFLNTSFTESEKGRKREGRPVAMIHADVMSQHGLADGDKVLLGNEKGQVALHAKTGSGQHRDTIVVESIWPNDAFEGGIGINLLISAEPGYPAGGGVIHDNAVWLERA